MAMEASSFLAASEAYGYGPDATCSSSSTTTSPRTSRRIDRIRAQEFARLRGGPHDHNAAPATTYLDHAGAALYSEQQLGCAFEELRSQLLSNPHR